MGKGQPGLIAPAALPLSAAPASAACEPPVPPAYSTGGVPVRGGPVDVVRATGRRAGLTAPALLTGPEKIT